MIGRISVWVSARLLSSDWMMGGEVKRMRSDMAAGSVAMVLDIGE